MDDEWISMTANASVMEETVGKIPWVSAAASAARQRYAQHVAERRKETLKEEKPATCAGASLDVDGRSAKIRKILEGAVAKLRAEAKEKEDRAVARQRELVKSSVVEFCRFEFGKKQKLAPDRCKRSWPRLASAAAPWLREVIRTHATSTQRG